MRKIINFVIIFSLLLAGYQNSFSEKDSNATTINQIQAIEVTCLQQDNPIIYKQDFSIKSEEFGDQKTFWVWDYEDLQYEEREATLLVVGEKCYVYMANITISEIGQAAAIARCNFCKDEFDAVTYDKNVELVGHPDGRLGDIDGDPKVTIFLTPLKVAGGCYLNKDDDPAAPYSNHREMFYIDSEMEKMEWSYTIMMAEFNHLIWLNYEQDEGHFLTEGIAEYANYYAGYHTENFHSEFGQNLTSETQSFATDYETSLLSWHIENWLFLESDYGKAYMFAFYLAERYGEELIKALVATLADGPQGIDDALAETGYNTTFNEVFLNWVTACTIDEEDYQNGIYGFKNADFTIIPNTIVSSYPYEEIDKKHYYYGFDVKKLITPPDKFTFKITNPHPKALGISIAIHDQHGWNVIQTVHSEEGETIVEYVSGEGIEEAYIITSVILDNTPTTFVDMYGQTNEPYYLLSYSIKEGHETTAKAVESIIGIAFGAMVVVFIFGSRITIIQIYKKKSK